jgi:hypothetical protein
VKGELGFGGDKGGEERKGRGFLGFFFLAEIEGYCRERRD